MERTKDFAKLIRAKLARDMDLADGVENEKFHANIATQVYEARVAAGMTQAELAKRIGTTQSVVSRIEDADYDGHSLALLLRIAAALGKRLGVELYDRPPPVSRSVNDRFPAKWGGGTSTEWHPNVRDVVETEREGADAAC